MLLTEFALLLAFGADAGQDTCATKSDVQDLSTLVDETKGEAAAARAQAAIAPQGSSGFTGLYKMAENASEIHNIANMKQIGVVGPGDWCARPHRPNAPATSHNPPDANCPPHTRAGKLCTQRVTCWLAGSARPRPESPRYLPARTASRPSAATTGTRASPTSRMLARACTTTA